MTNDRAQELAKYAADRPNSPVTIQGSSTVYTSCGRAYSGGHCVSQTDGMVFVDGQYRCSASR